MQKKKKQLTDLFWMVTVGQCRVHEVSKQEVEWVELAVRSRCSPFGCNSSCVQLFWRVDVGKQLRGKISFLACSLWHCSTPHMSRLSCSARKSGKNEHILVAFLAVKKKQISVYFLKSSREEGRRVSGAYVQLKKTHVTCKYLYLHVRQISGVCLCWCVCVSECTRGLFCKFTRTFVKAKVGLPACCYKIGSDYQDEKPGTEERRRTKTGSVTGAQIEKHRWVKWHWGRGGGRGEGEPEALSNYRCKKEHGKV